jgi:hypothetical protein
MGSTWPNKPKPAPPGQPPPPQPQPADEPEDVKRPGPPENADKILQQLREGQYIGKGAQ